ncbi:hypothetical protein C7M84_004081 [Penaeus vannamei]|uniref:Uncharacterized protein n=1 Tax=Penaeus vannamei TaxID=6689 RepID=A0A423TLF4_PENVA|nr:hypothetical protein C7M84_004081 [Penaeus vannamei]
MCIEAIAAERITQIGLRAGLPPTGSGRTKLKQNQARGTAAISGDPLEGSRAPPPSLKPLRLAIVSALFSQNGTNDGHNKQTEFRKIAHRHRSRGRPHNRMTSRRIYPSLFFTQIVRDTPICNPGINKVHDKNPSFGFNCCCWGERSPPARTHTQIRFLWSESRADVQNVTDCFPRERSHKGAVIPTAHAHCALPTPWPAPDCYRRRNRGFGADPLVISALFFISAISERFGLLLRGFDPKSFVRLREDNDAQGLRPYGRGREGLRAAGHYGRSRWVSSSHSHSFYPSLLSLFPPLFLFLFLFPFFSSPFPSFPFSLISFLSLYLFLLPCTLPHHHSFHSPLFLPSPLFFSYSFSSPLLFLAILPTVSLLPLLSCFPFPLPFPLSPLSFPLIPSFFPLPVSPLLSLPPLFPSFSHPPPFFSPSPFPLLCLPFSPLSPPLPFSPLFLSLYSPFPFSLLFYPVSLPLFLPLSHSPLLPHPFPFLPPHYPVSLIPFSPSSPIPLFLPLFPFPSFFALSSPPSSILGGKLTHVIPEASLPPPTPHPLLLLWHRAWP